MVNDVPVACLNLCGVAGAFLLFLHLDVEAGLIDCETVLATDEFCEVEGEAVGVEEGESLFAGNLCLSGSLCLLHHTVQELDARLECTQETLFLFLHHLRNEFALTFQFGIGCSHLLNEDGQQTIDEGFLLSEEGIGVAHGTAQDAADDVTCLCVARQLTVRNAECNGAQVVGNDAHGNVDVLRVIGVI